MTRVKEKTSVSARKAQPTSKTETQGEARQKPGRATPSTEKEGRTKAARSARLEARVLPEHKALIEQAAELSGLTVSEFVVSQILPIARKVVDTQLVIQLSLDEKRRLLELLKDFPEEAIARREATRLKAQQPIILPEESLAAIAARYDADRTPEPGSQKK